jgi:hypothetical protein
MIGLHGESVTEVALGRLPKTAADTPFGTIRRGNVLNLQPPSGADSPSLVVIESFGIHRPLLLREHTYLM